MGKWVYALPVLLALGLGLLFSRGLDLDPQAMPSALIDQPLPDVSSAQLTGQPSSPRQAVQGPALVNVWATWCISCVVEHPFLVDLSSQVPIYGLNYKDQDDKAFAWLEEKGDPYVLNWADRDGRLGLDFGVTGAQETYLVSAEGRVALRHQGVLDARVWQAKFAEYFPGVTR